MITRDEIFTMARQMHGCVIDQPFDEDFDTTVLRHSDSGKWFGLVFKGPCRKIGLDRDGETDLLNLKCDPLMSYSLSQAYSSIVPAYHMNKIHWISIILEKDLPWDILEMLMYQSYSLTRKKASKERNLSQSNNKTSAALSSENSGHGYK